MNLILAFSLIAFLGCISRPLVPVILGQTMDRNGPYQENDPFLGMQPTDDVVAGVGHNPTADRGQDSSERDVTTRIVCGLDPCGWKRAQAVAMGCQFDFNRRSSHRGLTQNDCCRGRGMGLLGRTPWATALGS